MEPYKYNPVFVIFVNDSPEFVWVGEEEGAKKKLNELADEYWEMHKDSIKGNMCYSRMTHADRSDEENLYKIYRGKYYWHIHNVNSNAQSPQG